MCDLWDAAHQFFPEPHLLTMLGDSSGFSGSHFARVEAIGAVWCLRGWPAGFDKGRLQSIYHALVHCRASGFTGVPALATTPAGDTLLERGGHLYDAQEWLAGEPLAGSVAGTGPMPNVVRQLPPSQLTTLATSLARFHGSTTGLEPAHAYEQQPLVQQMAEATEHVDRAATLLTGSVRERARGPEQAIIQHWVTLLPRAAAVAQGILQAHPVSASNTATLCHGDIWAAHVHFLGSRFCGFVDWESLCFSSPALDLAQLIVHFNGWQARDRVLGAYEAVLPLREEDKIILPAAALLDLVGEGCWSLMCLYGSPSYQIQGEAHMANLRTLVGSLRSIVDEFDTGESLLPSGSQ